MRLVCEITVTRLIIMMRIRRIPWLVLCLMLAGYTVLGHSLAQMDHPRWGLMVGSLVALSLAVIFLHPLTGLGRIIHNRFQSDTLAFCSLILLAGFVSVLLNWFKLFLPLFMIFACEALARIDLKTARISEVGTCVLLTTFSWIGLLLGWFAGGIYRI
jgi:hypothetical protein